MLKVDAGRNESVPRDERRALADGLLDELTAWHPRDRAGAFRSWHRGALSLVHLNVVAALEARGELSMSQLAEDLDVSIASVSGIVDRMERRDLVERRHATGDRRIVLVSLTRTGGAVFSDLQARRRAHLTRLLEELSDDELAGFLTGLRAMRAARARLAAADPAPEACAGSQPAGDAAPDR